MGVVTQANVQVNQLGLAEASMHACLRCIAGVFWYRPRLRCFWQIQLEGLENGGNAVTDLKLAIDVAQVGFHSADAHAQLRSDLLITVALGK